MFRILYDQYFFTEVSNGCIIFGVTGVSKAIGFVIVDSIWIEVHDIIIHFPKLQITLISILVAFLLYCTFKSTLSRVFNNF